MEAALSAILSTTSKCPLSDEPRHDKTGFLHMRKQRREADQHLCFRYIDSKIPLLLKYETSSF